MPVAPLSTPRPRPGFLLGLRPAAWLHLLAENRYRISAAAWPAAAQISLAALFNGVVGSLEDWRYAAALSQARPAAPLFILGFPRSGTTLLFQLLSRDPHFHYPTLYQTRFPSTFLLTQNWLPRLLAGRLASRRLQDAVAVDWNSPEEDEFAAALLGLRSALLGIPFAARRDKYEPYYTFSGVDRSEIEQWQAALLHFLRKLSLEDPRPLLLKSPMHTGRVRLLLELFPEARFVHIHRHPYDVFRSALHTLQQVWPRWELQAPAVDFDPAEALLQRYRATFQAYFADRESIPAGQGVEVAYAALESDPLGQMERIYSQLGLAGFAGQRPRLETYLTGLAGYQKNRFRPLEPELQERLQQACTQVFTEWGYPI